MNSDTKSEGSEVVMVGVVVGKGVGGNGNDAVPGRTGVTKGSGRGSGSGAVAGRTGGETKGSMTGVGGVSGLVEWSGEDERSAERVFIVVVSKKCITC